MPTLPPLSLPADLPLRVLVVDDDAMIRRLIRHWLEGLGAAVREAETGAEALRALEQPVDVVCLDLGLHDMGGLDLLQHLQARGSNEKVIVVTAERGVDVAVEAMRGGAYDYVTKPIDRERLLATLRRALELHTLETRVRRMEEQLGEQETRARLVGDSAPMREVQRQIDRVRESDVNVCVLGESGSGKEVVARHVHETSRRSKGPFVAINCAAIPAALQESELFGHERGAFTGAVAQHKGRFEQARGGTLFLDELGEMSAATQAALLRTLEERTIRRVGGTTDVPVDVRIVCATHRDLEGEVKKGRFREDLYFRLVVYPIRLPPLRERLDDLPLLLTHLLRRLRDDVGRDIRRVSPEALAALGGHAWPGNVRELQNVVHRALLSCQGDEITLADLPAELRPSRVAPAPSTRSAELPTLDLGELERRAIAKAMEQTKGNVEQAARLLGLGRATLYRRLATPTEKRS